MAAPPNCEFSAATEPVEQHWRSVVLFGRNVASYKFALAKSLLDLASSGHEQVSLDDLAVPFAGHLCQHLAEVDRQGTFEHSRFLDACRFFNAGRINEDELRTATATLGFNNVIDAFHIVGDGEIPTRFFVDERRGSTSGIRLTDDLIKLAIGEGSKDLRGEVESRWRLVEEAWDARADGRQVVVLYDSPRELLVPALLGKRRSITEVRPALNGYQKGHCFYCFKPIAFTTGTAVMTCDVDHFFPHSLMSRGLPIDLDQVWNLVLACTTCNRGALGKGARLPHDRYLERLNRRNEYLIGSHHPLRETLMLLTGRQPTDRRNFLRSLNQTATGLVGPRNGWTATDEQEALF